MTVKPGEAIPTMVDVARDYIRTAITNGTFGPGAHLKERDLCAELGISRIPIREALRSLATEGFVTFQPRRGVIVRTLAPAELDDIFEVREALEVQALVLCARKATTTELTALRATAARASAAHASGDIATVHQENTLFHDQVVAYAHSGLLAEMLTSIQSRLHWLFAQNDDPAAMCREHDEIAAAIAARDEATVRTLAHAHVQTSKRLAHTLLFASTKHTAQPPA